MALGWCMVCERLKPIRKLGLKLGSRECDWAPIEHDAPPTHRGCGGTVVGLDDGGFCCERCDHEILIDAIVPSTGRCLGTGRSIR